MSEHSPAPTPARAVYGFTLFLLSHTLFIIYVIWAYIPNSILEDKLGLHYLPDKYFALIIPVLLLTCVTMFAFFIYPSINLIITPNIDNIQTISDSFQIFRCQFSDIDGKICDNIIETKEIKDHTWNVQKFCKEHMSEAGRFSEEQTLEPEEFCDCTKNRLCLLRENPNHIKVIKNRRRIPAVRDLDLADVFENIFSK